MNTSRWIRIKKNEGGMSKLKQTKSEKGRGRINGVRKERDEEEG